MKRPAVNLTRAVRLARIAMGAACIAVGVLLLFSAGSALAISLEILLVLAGLDLAITGAIGHCPLYRRLGYTPPSMRGSV